MRRNAVSQQPAHLRMNVCASLAAKAQQQECALLSHVFHALSMQDVEWLVEKSAQLARRGQGLALLQARVGWEVGRAWLGGVACAAP